MKRVPSRQRPAHAISLSDLRLVVQGAIGASTPIASDKNPFPEPPPRTP